MGADEFEGMAREFEAEQFAAAFAEGVEGGEEELAAFGGKSSLFGIGIGVGEGEFIDGGGVVFATAVAFANMSSDFEAQDLEGDGEEILGRIEMAVLLVEHEEGLLRKVFGGAVL